jgi:carbon-monoxide dehydrogenase large subunit
MTAAHPAGPQSPAPAPRYVGVPLRRKEDPRLLRGAGRYVADIQLPGLLHAAFLRSPHAHARIRAIDLTRARAQPGVVAAFAFPDIARWARPLPMLVPHPALRPRMHWPLARDRVRYVGEAVAMVVAEDPYLAEDALEAIGVDWEVLPAVTSGRAALAPDAPRLHDDLDSNLACELTAGFGDVERAFAEADLVIEHDFRIQRMSGQPLETRGVVARWDEGKHGPELTVWDSTQSAHTARRVLAEIFQLPWGAVRVIAPDVGGGFGVKNRFYQEEAAVPIAARLVGRPVKWIEDRRENLLAAYASRDQEHHAAIALRRDGTILGVRNDFIADQGAYSPFGIVVPYNTIITLPGAYKLHNYQARMRVAYTSKTPIAPFRAAGRPAAVWVLERLLDRAARTLGLDPAEIRFRNLVRPEEMPFAVGLRDVEGAPMVYDSGDYPAALRQALALLDYPRQRAEQARARAEGRYLGIGLGCYVEPTGGGPFESAVVRVEVTGKVTVITGACSQGQSHETTLAQLCAERLGVRVEDVTVVGGDTAGVALGGGTYASRSGVTAGMATSEAALQVRRKALRMAAVMLEAAVEDLELVDGEIRVRGAPERRLPLAQVARTLAAPPPLYVLPPDLEPGLEATVYWRPEAKVYACGAHACLVEVDPETGAVRLLKYVVAHDCGTVINPLVADGQVHGGVAQGIGTALYEQIVHDAQGQVLTASYLDYLLPGATEVPPIVVGHLCSPSPRNREGLKGLGEGGIYPSLGVISNAVEDALAPFGAVLTELPLTPERVRAAIEAAQRAR